MHMQRGSTPFSQFGKRLKEIRRSSQESLLEVSGAVELDSDTLTRFEQGVDRPSEDILMLLISHFDMREEEADELWELAGYNQLTTPDMSQVPTLVVVPQDNRIIYTDTANVSINNHGVVMNFMQNNTNDQSISIARVGMSMEHAKNLLEILANTMARAEKSRNPKQLPQSSEVSTKKKRLH